MRTITFICILLFIPAFGDSQEIQQSHISENLPDTFEEFQVILKRDLEAYFQKHLGRPVTIEYDLLRKAPTQSGVSFPKFYAWISVKESGKVMESGAVRVAAIKKVRIEVTDFVSRKEILNNQSLIDSIFPKALCDGIRNRAK
jgi:hypothetical protein